MAALQKEQWKAAISEMYRVLVPGGWVQLFEGKYRFTSPLEAIEQHKTFAISLKVARDVRHIVIDIVYHLQSWLEEAGFINVKIEKRGLPLGSWAGEHGAANLKFTMAFMDSIKILVLKEGGLGLVSSEEEYDSLVDNVTKLCDKTPETYFEYWVFVAQKPAA